MKRKIVIGSRGSDLALWQANHIKSMLAKAGVSSAIRVIRTKGDKIQHLGFDKMEGKGFFTKEIETALLAEEIDLAVHSHKDLETCQPEGLKVAAVSEREDPAEWLLLRKTSVDAEQSLSLKPNPVVGTSSARRKSQLLDYRPDIQLKDLRGNVPTRINKLREGPYDAIVLAGAGINRLNLDVSDLEVVRLDPLIFVPAPAQGVLALQVRAQDAGLAATLQLLNDPLAQECIGVERDVLRLLQGGCQLPLGAYCRKQHNGGYALWVTMAESWDAPLKRLHFEAEKTDGMAANAIDQLRKKKAGAFL